MTKTKSVKIQTMNFAGSAGGIMSGAIPTIVNLGVDPERISIDGARNNIAVVEYIGDDVGKADIRILPIAGRKLDPIDAQVSDENPVAYINTRFVPKSHLHGGDFVVEISGTDGSSVRVTVIEG